MNKFSFYFKVDYSLINLSLKKLILFNLVYKIVNRKYCR